MRISPQLAAEFRRTRLEEGDVLLSVMATIGRTMVVPSTLVGANVNRAVAVLRPVERKLLAEYLCWFFRSPYFRATFAERRLGTAQQRINLGDLEQFAVPLPPESELRRVLDAIKSHLDRHARVASAVESTRESLSLMERAVLAKAFRGELVPQDPYGESASVLLDRIRAAQTSVEPGAGSRRRSRKTETVADESIEGTDDDGGDAAAPLARSASSRGARKDIIDLHDEAVHDEVFAALWPLGPLEKHDAVRRVAAHLRETGHVEFQRLRADGPLYAQLLGFIEAAVKAGRLDRPKRGQVRARKADATTYTPDDWRLALVTSLGTEPSDRDDAIRAAAEWARDNLGLEFSRLRSDGHIVEGLRSAINSAIRRGEVIRHGATHIARASGEALSEPAQLSLPLATDDDDASSVGTRGAVRRRRA
jgi:hypothetical protein